MTDRLPTTHSYVTDEQRNAITHDASLRRGVPKALTQGDGDAGSTVEWETPNDLFDALDSEFGPFTLDPATALGYHTSNVLLCRSGQIVTRDGTYFGHGLNRPEHFAQFDDGLDVDWTGRVYLNHPYGRADWRWMKKAHDSVRFGDADIVVALVPVKTQMKWWRKYVGATDIRRERCDAEDDCGGDFATIAHEGADVIRFVPRRLRFGGAPSSAPFNSAVIVWRK